MNSANLQLEGLLMAVIGLNRILVAKGLLSTAEIEQALAMSEQTALADERVSEDLSPASRDAIAFPIRVLRLANLEGIDGDPLPFSRLARRVGQTKEPYNDQR